MKLTCMITIALALLLAPPLYNGGASDGKDKQIAPTYSDDETMGKKDNRVVNNLMFLPIRDDALRMQLWKELVRLAQPDTLKVPANTSTLKALKDRYGSAPPDLQRILAKLNPGQISGYQTRQDSLYLFRAPFGHFRNLATLKQI